MIMSTMLPLRTTGLTFNLMVFHPTMIMSVTLEIGPTFRTMGSIFNLIIFHLTMMSAMLEIPLILNLMVLMMHPLSQNTIDFRSAFLTIHV